MRSVRFRLTDTFEQRRSERWSRYATELYVRLRGKAKTEGWLHKLRFLLYEGGITGSDAAHFQSMHGVLLQSKPGPGGTSQNDAFAMH